MALVSRHWRDDDWLWPEHNSIWRDRFSRDWDDWPLDWPRPRDLIDRFRRDTDRWWRDWPTDWPRMDTIVPRFSSHLDRFDRNWRQDPFWRDLYPRWAEPIFKEGIDVKTSIVNDRSRFAVDIDTYQFRPEELQVKTLDDTLLIEGRHEEVRDADNYTKMYFVRKYQLPPDVIAEDITSSIDSRGRLMVEARKRSPAIEGHERTIPIESSSAARAAAAASATHNMLRPGSRSSSYSPRDRHDSGRGSDGSAYLHGGGTPLPPPRTESRNTLDPNYNNGYRNEFSKRETDGNGMRHETRREEFREQFRRTGSHSSLAPPPLTDFPRVESRLSNNGIGGGGGNSSSHHYRAHSSTSRNGFRSETPYSTAATNDHFLRPSEELNGGGERSRAESARSVRISKTYN